jgi:hypothetical protein
MLDTGRRERVSYPSAKWFRRLESAYLRPSASWLSSTPNLSGRVQPDRLQYVFTKVHVWKFSRSTHHSVADALRAWLPRVIQAIDPWLSSADIERAHGTKNSVIGVMLRNHLRHSRKLQQPLAPV